VVGATNIEQAIEILSTLQTYSKYFDLAIIDIELGDQNGLVLTQQIARMT
jgi:DNA-binding response OmpR family regulator